MWGHHSRPVREKQMSPAPASLHPSSALTSFTRQISMCWGHQIYFHSLLHSPDLHVLGSPDILVWGHHMWDHHSRPVREKQMSPAPASLHPSSALTSFTRQISMCWGHQIYLCGGIICGVITVVLFEKSKCLLLLLHFIRLQHSHTTQHTQHLTPQETSQRFYCNALE